MIGSSNDNSSFIGTYHGGGHTIKDLNMEVATEVSVGLFGCIKNSIIDSLSLQGGIRAGSRSKATCVGGLVGVQYGGSISYCSSSGIVSISGTNDFYIGGLVGYLYYGSISYCSASGTVYALGDLATSVAGGLVGCECSYSQSVPSITYWTASTNVNSSGSMYTYSGGLVGSQAMASTDATLEQSHSISDSSITYCSASGNVYASTVYYNGNVYTGGLIGCGSAKNCYATGNVAGLASLDEVEECVYAGGLVGYGNATNCYATGNVYVSVNQYAYAGGLVGANSALNSFWNIETSGKTTGIGNGTNTVTGLTTTQMQTQSTFTNAGWDFVNTWAISSNLNNGFPYLQWQKTVAGALSLPVELSAFTATASTSSATLKWSTATEVNNYGYDIERRLVSVDASTVVDAQTLYASMQWTKVGFVAGNGTSNVAHTYSYTDANVSSGKYAYRLKQIDNSGTYKYSSEAEVSVTTPKNFMLSQNYPNPFNPTTTITYDIPAVGSLHVVTLKVYDIIGREVATLVNESKEAGSYQVTFNASKLASGSVLL